jgi:hypothetical protein
VNFQVAVEGELDDAVIRRIAEHVGAEVGSVFGKEGKPHLRGRIDGYNAAAQWSPWVVLVDLDASHECAAELRADWLPDESSLMCFRVAVRQVESWLLADFEQCASYLGISKALLPRNPDEEPDAKARLVHLAGGSRWRRIREAIVPAEGSGRSVGPLYNATLRQFVSEEWRPEVAASRSDSLRRCLMAVNSLREKAGAGT